MGFDTAYQAMTAAMPEEGADTRWAFGTGFTDPLEGIDITVPAGLDGHDIAEYCLMLGDDALVFSHRLQQWLTRAPELEEETALANIGLDLLGQARLLLARAGVADGSGRDEDAYAFWRSADEFRNSQFVEPAADDFAELVVRLLVFSVVRLAVLNRLRESRDPFLAAVAAKAANEVAYHCDYAALWVLRLGDGTSESHARTERAVGLVVPTLAELFTASAVERRLVAAGVAVDPGEMRVEVVTALSDLLARATVEPPDIPVGAADLGREGHHTADLDDVLAELQGLARQHPDATW